MCSFSKLFINFHVGYVESKVDFSHFVLALTFLLFDDCSTLSLQSTFVLSSLETSFRDSFQASLLGIYLGSSLSKSSRLSSSSDIFNISIIHAFKE